MKDEKIPHGTHGVVVVDKPQGVTSHDVVNRLRKIYGTKRVGHTGTLDPLATGVLVACLGNATRIVEYLTAARKAYVAGLVLGVTTDSEDATGEVLTQADAGRLTEEDVQAVLPQFAGSILQTPPMVSAVHHEGKRLYKLARQGVVVEREARPVEVYRLELSDFRPGERATATLDVECSTGTYIRTLCADIGAALGVGGMMESLRRTSVGAFTLDEALTLEQLKERKEAGSLQETVRPIAVALSGWPHMPLNEEGLSRVAHGQPVPYRGEHAGPLLLTGLDGEAVAIAEVRGRTAAPVKVFLSSD
jgi:tRNA pseudouridine55 synthase